MSTCTSTKCIHKECCKQVAPVVWATAQVAGRLTADLYQHCQKKSNCYYTITLVHIPYGSLAIGHMEHTLRHSWNPTPSQFNSRPTD